MVDFWLAGGTAISSPAGGAVGAMTPAEVMKELGGMETVCTAALGCVEIFG